MLCGLVALCTAAAGAFAADGIVKVTPLGSHVHGDHLGDRHIPAANAGAGATPDMSVKAVPESNSAKNRGRQEGQDRHRQRDAALSCNAH